jgi:hypothetical protein
MADARQAARCPLPGGSAPGSGRDGYPAVPLK